jgi:CspA family cold shock protein
MESTKVIGLVKWFHPKKGYGFIVGPKQEDVFVHFSYVDMDGYRTLNKGQKVQYDLTQTDRGPQAHNVTPVD